MSTQGSESNPTQPPSSLQSMLARLRGMMQTLKSIDPPAGKTEENQSELLPTWDVAKASESAHSPERVTPTETPQSDAGSSPISSEAPALQQKFPLRKRINRRDRSAASCAQLAVG